jgi:hypothetical protein
VSRIMTNPTVKAFYESFADNVIDQIQIQGRNQISVQEPEPDSELKHGDDTRKSK